MLLPLIVTDAFFGGLAGHGEGSLHCAHPADTIPASNRVHVTSCLILIRKILSIHGVYPLRRADLAGGLASEDNTLRYAAGSSGCSTESPPSANVRLVVRLYWPGIRAT